MQEIAVEARVTGRVHGVGFRFFVKEEAETLGLRGWVRNERDGSVEMLFVGDREPVSKILDAVKVGPPAAIVADVQSSATSSDNAGHGFHIMS